MISQRRLAVVGLCLSLWWAGVEYPHATQSTSNVTQGPSSKIWVGRYREIEEYLKTAECLTVERLPPIRCNIRPGGPVARMAWLPLRPGTDGGFVTSYKTQIAAYELDKILKMDMLPPSVERQLEGNTGAATLWVENVDTWKGEAPPADANVTEWQKQVARMRMFDALIGNRNRNQLNVLRDRAWNLILLDHTRAFGTGTELRSPLSRIDQGYWDRVLALTRKELEARLGPWLDENEIAAMLARRERMKAEIDRLISERGAPAVVLR